MHPCLIKEPFSNRDWIYEVKYDGYRMLSYVEQGSVSIYSRRKTDFTKRYPGIAAELAKLKCDVVLDGEVVVLNEKGVTDFHKLQYYSPKHNDQLVYFVFDILMLNGKELFNLPLMKRKAALKKIFPKSDFIKYVDHVKEKGIEFFHLLEQHQAEGMVCKLKNSLYLPGKRSDCWLKVKTTYHKAMLDKYPREF